MSHAAMGAMRVQHPTQSFGQSVRGIGQTRKMLHQDATVLAPPLDGKVLDLNMASRKTFKRQWAKDAAFARFCQDCEETSKLGKKQMVDIKF